MVSVGGLGIGVAPRPAIRFVATWGALGAMCTASPTGSPEDVAQGFLLSDLQEMTGLACRTLASPFESVQHDFSLANLFWRPGPLGLTAHLFAKGDKKIGRGCILCLVR